MGIDKIEKIWETLIYEGKGEITYKLFSVESIPLLNLGINKNGQRCLILELPIEFHTTVNENNRDNISLKYYLNQNCISITLNDSYFEDLFNDLILSIYVKIWKINKVKEYTSFFISYYYKWLTFFDQNNSKLSKDLIKGIWGEIFYLNHILHSSGNDVNNQIKSWQGPYDKGHDFIFDLYDHEVKTIDNSRNNISISSEFQLEKNKDKSLELIVLTVEENNKEGFTIKGLCKIVRDKIIAMGGDITLFSDALFQKGLSFGNLNLYDDFSFKAKRLMKYNCAHESFPKLINSNLPNGISSVSYTIKLNKIEEYLISETDL